MMTINQLLQRAGSELSAISDSAFLDAEILLAHALCRPRSFLRAHASEEVAANQAQQFATLIARRLQREPVAYITGSKEFWSLDLHVNRSTLIPRPETELIIETVLELFPEKNQHIKAADLGTGSGAIAIALASERPNWEIFAVDNSDIALQTASDNAQRLGFKRISFCLGSWFTALPAGLLDLVVSNPPYVSEDEWPGYAENLSFEPRTALLSEENGLRDVREICENASRFIRPGGYIILEHGFQQGLPVRELLISAGCCQVRTVPDLSGRERVTVGQLKAP